MLLQAARQRSERFRRARGQGDLFDLRRGYNRLCGPIPTRPASHRHGHVRTRVDLRGLLWTITDTRGHRRTCVDSCKSVRVCTDTIRTHTNLCGHRRKRPNSPPGRLKRSVAGAERFASAGLLPSACGHGRLTAWLRPVYLFQGRLGVKDNLVASIPRNIGLVRPRHARAGGIAVVR